jgi:hypothetical protein
MNTIDLPLRAAIIELQNACQYAQGARSTSYEHLTSSAIARCGKSAASCGSPVEVAGIDLRVAWPPIYQ